MYCNTLVCIAGWEARLAETVSQYSLVYCGRKMAGKKICIAIQKNCIVTVGIVGCWTVSQHRPRHGAGHSRRARGRAAGQAGLAG